MFVRCFTVLNSSVHHEGFNAMTNVLHILGTLSEAVQECDAARARTSHDATIRKIVSEVMHHSTKSRAQIADELSQLVDVEVTANMLNGYAAPSKTGVRFPAAFINAFCQVTGDDRLQRFLLSPVLRKKIEIVERELTAAQEKHQAQLLREQLLEEQKSLPLFTDESIGCVVPQRVSVRNFRSMGGGS
jgi:hypothetical protein